MWPSWGDSGCSGPTGDIFPLTFSHPSTPWGRSQPKGTMPESSTQVSLLQGPATVAQEGRGEARTGLPPAPLPSAHWLCLTAQGAPKALVKPGQEGWVSKLCSSASRANRGFARKGSRSQAFGNCWIKATAVLEGSSVRASESLGVPPPRARPMGFSTHSL